MADEKKAGGGLAVPRTAQEAGSITDRPISVRLESSAVTPTSDEFLFIAIRNRTAAISFDVYKSFVDGVMCGQAASPTPASARYPHAMNFRGLDAYNLLDAATEAFLMQECGVLNDKQMATVDADAEAVRVRHPVDLAKMRNDYLEALAKETDVKVLPYFKIIRERLSDLPLKSPDTSPANCYGLLRSQLTDPCLLELIWSYWHEEAMLVQALNAISLRFQNRRTSSGRDPLSNLELDPLRPLSNLIWGYIQTEKDRLTVVRRAYEYDHHYGLQLQGKAISDFQPADSRSKFLEAFHNLLQQAVVFFKQDDDTTVRADGFPVLNALKEVHLLLTQGMHNQFGDLPFTARKEMLIQEWLLARPEMREFLGGRLMFSYPEPWMDRVDTMKSLQGWHDTPSLHFRDLGVFGEQLLLSARYGAWTAVTDPASAANWARYWRPEIQGYIHAYRVVTGIDLAAPTTATSRMADRSVQPSVLLRQRLQAQRPAR